MWEPNFHRFQQQQDVFSKKANLRPRPALLPHFRLNKHKNAQIFSVKMRGMTDLKMAESIQNRRFSPKLVPQIMRMSH